MHQNPIKSRKIIPKSHQNPIKNPTKKTVKISHHITQHPPKCPRKSPQNRSKLPLRCIRRPKRSHRSAAGDQQGHEPILVVLGHKDFTGKKMVILWDFHDFTGILWDFHDFMGILWDFMEFSSSSPSENRDLGLNRPQVSQLSAKIENWSSQIW